MEVFSQRNYRHFFFLFLARIAFHVLKHRKPSVTRQTSGNCQTKGENVAVGKSQTVFFSADCVYSYTERKTC